MWLLDVFRLATRCHFSCCEQQMRWWTIYIHFLLSTFLKQMYIYFKWLVWPAIVFISNQYKTKNKWHLRWILLGGVSPWHFKCPGYSQQARSSSHNSSSPPGHCVPTKPLCVPAPPVAFFAYTIKEAQQGKAICSQKYLTNCQVDSPATETLK